MGLIADFIVATESDALKYAESGGELGGIERCDYKNYTSLSIAELWALLEDKVLNLDHHDLEEVLITDDGESWLFRFPDKLSERIAKINSDRIETIAAKWSESEEVPGDGPDNEPVLNDLIRLCNSARTGVRHVYLWGSL